MRRHGTLIVRISRSGVLISVILFDNALCAEFLPYRVSDSTVARDMLRLSWFCSHGYVCVRVDMRGSGNSEGFYYDEYEKQEQDDCCDVIKWISEQDWCTGAVGKCCFAL